MSTAHIALIDYGMGNLHSVAKALEHVGGKVRLVREPERLRDCERMVLPGVGAFRDCMHALRAHGMEQAILERLREGMPFLGICLGMQALLERSLEYGEHTGLGWFSGQVEPFPDSLATQCKIPHMGWNDLYFPDAQDIHPVLEPLRSRQVYFVHSYHCAPQNPQRILATCQHGNVPFVAAMGWEHVLAVQFHPEKSQRAGLAMLERFVRWNP